MNLMNLSETKQLAFGKLLKTMQQKNSANKLQHFFFSEMAKMHLMSKFLTK